MTNLNAPKININGSHPQALINEHIDAMTALREAIKAVEAVAPHPRDWQTVNDGGESYRLAREAHVRRLRDIERIASELETIALAVQLQMAVKA